MYYTARYYNPQIGRFISEDKRVVKLHGLSFEIPMISDVYTYVDNNSVMRFEGRELKDYSEPMSPADLVENTIYFSVGFVDDQLMVPELEPLVFVGRNLRSGESDVLYFQDIESYRQGSRFGVPVAAGASPGHFTCFDEQDVDVYDYEHALDLLLACSLRQRSLGLR